MDLRQLKEKLEKRNVVNEFIIFECQDNYFVANQYIEAISEINNKPIINLTELSSYNLDNDYLYVFEKDTINDVNIEAKNNLIIKCKKFDSNILSEYVISIPGLEHWQIKNYVVANLFGPEVEFEDSDVDKFLCKYKDIFRINMEMKKINQFPDKERVRVFKYILDENIYTSDSIYDFIDMFVLYDKSKFKPEYLDMDPIYVINNLRNIFTTMLKMTNDSSLSYIDLNISYNQFKYLKSVLRYSLVELNYILLLLNSTYDKIISGEINKNLALSYLVCEIF